MRTQAVTTAKAEADSLIRRAALELEEMRDRRETRFPLACRHLLRTLPGNSHCADCGAASPDWASVTFGSLYCMVCIGRHRSFGVQTSLCRSVDLDAWTHEQVLAVLEGGNAQLEGFLDRHSLGRHSAKARSRYHTKAGQFYKNNLRQHVHLVADSGVYQGREASRLLYQQKMHAKQQQLQKQDMSAESSGAAASAGCNSSQPSTNLRMSSPIPVQ
jgi:hypothetical protein